MSDDHECSRCGKIVHVPDGRDFGDGDMCWDCTIETQAAEIMRLTAALADANKKVADLEEPAGFGWQCYQDRCENAYVESSVVKKLQAELNNAENAAAILADQLAHRDKRIEELERILIDEVINRSVALPQELIGRSEAALRAKLAGREAELRDVLELIKARLLRSREGGET